MQSPTALAMEGVVFAVALSEAGKASPTSGLKQRSPRCQCQHQVGQGKTADTLQCKHEGRRSMQVSIPTALQSVSTETEKLSVPSYRGKQQWKKTAGRTAQRSCSVTAVPTTTATSVQGCQAGNKAGGEQSSGFVFFFVPFS